MARSDHRSPLSTTLDKFNQSLGRFLGVDNFGGLSSAKDEWRPATDIRQNELRYLLEIELPGIAQDDIDISLVQGELTIRCQRFEEASEDIVIRRERHLGGFVRHFQLPVDAQGEQITAHLERGVLLINVPRNGAKELDQITVR